MAKKPVTQGQRGPAPAGGARVLPAPSRARFTASRSPVWLLLAAVFVVKLILVVQLKDHPLVQPDVGLDTSAYVELANRVRAGDLGLGPGLYYLSPLYIYFLAAVLAITDSFTAIRVLQIALGTLATGAVYLTARAWFGERAAWFAAILTVLTGLFTFYEALILQASLDTFLTAAALLALTFGLQRSQSRWLLAAGVILGVAALNRPNIAVAAAGVALAMVVIQRRVAPAALVVAGVVAGMTPVAIRNAVVAGHWSFTSSHGGLNFYIGNSETATGFYHQIPGISPNIVGQASDARRVAGKALGRQVTDAEASGYFFDQALSWIRQDPWAALKLFAYKLGFAFHAQHIALPYSYPFYRFDAPTILPVLAVGPWLLVPLGLVGLVFAAPPAQRANYLAWAAFLPAYGAAVAIFFVAERYRLPLLVPLSIGAGAAMDAAARLITERRLRALVLPAVCFAALFAAVNWPTRLHDGRWEEGLRMAQRLVILGRYDEADTWAQRLEAGAPRRGMAHHGVGLQLLAANQPARALGHLEQAQALDPGQPSVEFALGQALRQNGRAAEAVIHLRKGIEGGVQVPLADYDLALALQAAGDLPAAASAIRRIVPGDDQDAEVWLKLGRLATELKAPDVAEPFFRQAVAMQPALASARVQYGLNLLLLARFDEAVRELSAAVRLNPRDADALSNLAYCELSIGRLEDARTHVDAALALDPAHPFARQVAAAVRR